MSTAKYYVSSINCNHCVHTIQSELSELKGVISVEADLVSKYVTVAYEPPASEEQIKDLLKEINYPVTS